MIPDLRVEYPHLQIPVTLLVDDPGPCVNPFYYHRRLREPAVEPKLPSGETVVRSVPVSFLRRFVEVVEFFGIRGKFSVLPCPCNLGYIGRGIEGYPESECREWVATVRERLAGRMDFSPEVISHLYAVDLETLRPLAEDEHTWSQHQDEETLTRYLAKALRLLADAGIDATGVTSPWMFGEKVEGAYARAVGQAQKQVHGRGLTWYFLRSDPLSPWVPPLVATGNLAAGEAVIHVRPSSGDAYWRTQDTLECGDAYVASVVEPLISGDLSAGRIPALVTAGSGVTLLTHWQSLYSQDRATGLEALAETARRLVVAFGSLLAWRSCSELASWTAATASLRSAMVPTDRGLQVDLTSPFACDGLTLSTICPRKPRRVRLIGVAGPGPAEGVDLPLQHASRLPLATQRCCWQAGRLSVCFDLRGPVRLEVEF